jgi:PAS domain S-box-containing protein
MKNSSAPKQISVVDAAPDAIDELPLPYIEMDATGRITRVNRATLALHSPDQGKLIGRMAWEFMPGDEKNPSCAAYLALMESGGDPPVVYRSLYDRSGEYRTYAMYRSLMRDEEGRPSGMRMLSLDVTEEKRELEEARRARLWLESVIASLADAVLVTDALGFIRSANPAAETLFGWRFAELEGKLIEKALPVLSYVSDDPTKLSFTMSLAGHCRGIATILDRESREVRVEIGTSPILNKESGFTEGVVAVLRTLEQAA